MVTPTADTCDAVAQGDFAGVTSSLRPCAILASVVRCGRPGRHRHLLRGLFFVGCVCWLLALQSRFAVGRAVATPWQSFGWTALVAVVGATLVWYAATSTFFRGVYVVGVVVATSLLLAWRLARPHILGLAARPSRRADSS